MTSSEAPPGRAGKRRTVLIVSLVAILVLGTIGASLLLFTDNDKDSTGQPVPATELSAETRFHDPQGAYSLELDPKWQAAASANTGGKNVSTWFTQTGDAAFRDNVAIVSQNVGEVDLDQYLQLVIDQAGKSVDDYKLREFRVVTIPATSKSATPKQLGVVAFDGRRGDQQFGFLLVASVESGNAVVATLTTQQDRFDTVRSKVEPYLMTLRQT